MPATLRSRSKSRTRTAAKQTTAPQESTATFASRARGGRRRSKSPGERMNGGGVRGRAKSPSPSPSSSPRPARQRSRSKLRYRKDGEKKKKGGVKGVAAGASGKLHGGGGVSWRDDAGSIALLLLLYTLQGIPMGLCNSIPFLIQDKESGFHDQAVFNLVSWPFSLKLLWAPLVDALFIPRVGRRKSWLIPVQLLVGVFMVPARGFLGGWLGDDGAEGVVSIRALTAYFFALYFLMATQDIAVDGWALTMLQRHNVGYASTCNSIGQTLGFFIAYVGFLTLNDPATCNRYFRSTPAEEGLVSLPGFVAFWGWVFLATTALLLFKPEAAPSDPEAVGAEAGAIAEVEMGQAGGALAKQGGDDEEVSDEVVDMSENLGVAGSYSCLYNVMRLPPVQLLCIVLLTCKVAFAATDSIAALKFTEYGVPKEEMAMLASVLGVPLGVFVPMVIAKFTSGPRPLSLFVWGVPLRLGVGILMAFVVSLVPEAYSGAGDGGSFNAPMWFYCLLVTASILHDIASNLMFVAQMAFFAKVSDPKIGGTYMTLLNTIANLGHKWPSSLALFLVDPLTRSAGIDGYFVLVAGSTAIGAVWFALMHKKILGLQDVPGALWRIRPELLNVR